MSEFKYIILDCEKRGKAFHVPVMFSKLLDHNRMAVAMRRALLEKDALMIGVISAGFVNPNRDYHCYGKSETLGIESRPVEDCHLLRNPTGSGWEWDT